MIAIRTRMSNVLEHFTSVDHELRSIYCEFPVSREFGCGDWFAADCIVRVGRFLTRECCREIPLRPLCTPQTPSRLRTPAISDSWECPFGVLVDTSRRTAYWSAVSR